MNIAAAISILLFLIASTCSARGERLVSPPVWAADNKCVVVNIPKGWKIIDRDPPEMWNSSSFDMTLKETDGSARTIEVEILMHAIGRAQRHGDMSGTAFTTRSGLHGILHLEYDGGGLFDWYLSIPNKARTGVLIVRIGNLGSFAGHDRFANTLYRGIHFNSPVVGG